MDKFIPLSVPNFIGNEKAYVDDALDAGWVSTGGALIEKFEKNIAAYCGVKYAVAVQSGTAGLHLACKEAGVSAGDEVIVPTLTFIAAINPVVYCNANPVFMDCDDSLCIDVSKVKAFCKNECEFINGKLINKKTKSHVKAIIAVHIFGNMCDMEQIMNLASAYNLKVIEDATEALGSYYIAGKFKDKFAGTIGDIGVFSFNGNKIITTGGGGMLVTNNEQSAKHLKYLSTQAKDDELYFIHNEIGYNYRMTNLQAALGVAQLEMLEEFIKIKKRNHEKYISLGLNLLPFLKTIRPNYWFYSLMTRSRDGIIRFLNDQKIQARPIWTLIHTLAPYQSMQSYRIEKATYYYENIVNVPCSSNLTFEEVEKVSDKVKEYEKNAAN